MSDLPGALWKKSSRSGQYNQCVEVALNLSEVVAIRDSKLGEHSPILRCTPAAFRALTDSMKSGQLY